MGIGFDSLTNPSDATRLQDCHRRTKPFGRHLFELGCIPTNALLKSAELYSSLSHLEEFGGFVHPIAAAEIFLFMMTYYAATSLGIRRHH